MLAALFVVVCRSSRSVVSCCRSSRGHPLPLLQSPSFLFLSLCLQLRSWTLKCAVPRQMAPLPSCCCSSASCCAMIESEQQIPAPRRRKRSFREAESCPQLAPAPRAKARARTGSVRSVAIHHPHSLHCHLPRAFVLFSSSSHSQSLFRLSPPRPPSLPLHFLHVVSSDLFWPLLPLSGDPNLDPCSPHLLPLPPRTDSHSFHWSRL